MMRHLSVVFALAVLTSGVSEAGPPIRWDFESLDSLPGSVHGDVDVVDSQLQSPRYPTIESANKVLQLKVPAWISIPDDPKSNRFDFDNGDVVTFEAWVRVDSLGENMCLVSKGRTGSSGAKAINQNWAFRLRKNKGQACLNFLFRSRKTDDHPGDWHRWTSSKGLSSGSRWHHVAVGYEFGKPDSIRGFVDGKEVKGKWDMGGKTSRPPVVDDDEVWIGSTMAGNKSNSLNGAIDRIVLHRERVSNAELASRFKFNPPPVKAPEIPPGKVVVQLFGSVDSISRFPLETTEPLIEWTQDEMGFVRLPYKYDSWGVRDDWGKTLLVRAWSDVRLAKGDWRLLGRSRGMSRLKIDGKEVLQTAVQKNRGGAHHVVDAIPEVPVPGMRPHAMNDREEIVPYESDGETHRFLYEIIIGGPSYRLEFGETCLAIAKPNGMFHLISDSSKYPLTDDRWLAFVDEQSARLTLFDRKNRQAANERMAEYWATRHKHARRTLLDSSVESGDSSDAHTKGIDELIAQRVDEVNAIAAKTPAAVYDNGFFKTHIRPIFDTHCIRCHGDKQQGGLLIVDRERLLKGGESAEPAVVPGKPDDSYLLQLVTAHEDEGRMPPKGEALAKTEIAVLRKWIQDGAPMPAVSAKPVVQPPVVDDHTFLRRVFIDTVGVPPTIGEASRFLNDQHANRRERLVDRLLTDERWADNWVGYWQDVLAENPNLLKPTLNNTGPFRYWIHEALVDNKPLDRFATELILMRGSKWGGGAAGFAVASQNDVPMAAKAHVIGSAFLGVNMKCARCHDAPYHEWKQSDLFQMAAMLERKDVKLPSTSTVPTAFFEKQQRKSLIEVSLKPNEVIAAHFPFAELAPSVDPSLLTKPSDTREQLAAQVTSSRRFAEVLANRVWKRLMGAGLIEPVDDWEGAVPANPKLLAALADQLIDVDYDLKKFARTILVSDVYQRAATDLPSRREQVFAGPYRRRMSAEQIVDSAIHAVGQQMQTEQLTMDVEGTLPPDRFMNFGFPRRSWEFTTLANERDRPSLALPKIQAIADVLKAFGWRNSRPEPETDREEAPDLIQPGVLANGTLGIWLTRLSDESDLTKTMMKPQTVEQLVNELFLRVLTRPPTSTEAERFADLLKPGYDSRIVPKSQIGSPHEKRRFPYVSWSNHLNSQANVIKVEMQELVRQGPSPTRYLTAEWRERAEDAVWALLNSPESILIP